jgi:hypothetical protein
MHVVSIYWLLTQLVTNFSVIIKYHEFLYRNKKLIGLVIETNSLFLPF